VSDPLLSVDDLHASYGESHILRGVTLEIKRGEVASLVGRNGAGKTTTLRSIMGVLSPDRGTVTFAGEDITHLEEHLKTRRGMRFVPEDRKLFPDLTVHENLRMGATATEESIFTIDEVFEAFPRLDERRNNRAQHLSGGEQQMLAIARALVGKTELLLLDEPTEGLAPQIVEDVLDIIRQIRSKDVTVLLAEQNVRAAMAVVDRHYIIDTGCVVFEGTSEEIENDDELQQRYLGVGNEAETAFD
jgi:branched-chain amino acid transport system ATP-binding protein